MQNEWYGMSILLPMQRRIKMSHKIIAFLLIMIMIAAFIPNNIYGLGDANTLEFDKDGNLTFTTQDRKAIVNVKYKTLGWTIFNADRSKSVVLQLEQVSEKNIDSIFVETTFKTDKDTIFERIGEVDKDWQKDLYLNGGDVILDGIFTVVENGIVKGKLLDEGRSKEGDIYYKKNSIGGVAGIVDAKPWMTPSDFDDYFDKRLYFDPHPELILVPGIAYVKYFTDTGTPLDAYNSDQTMEVGNTYSVSNSTINGYDFVGSKMSYDVLPTGTMTPTKDYTLNYTGAYKDAYIYYYYKNKGAVGGAMSTNGMSASPTAVIKADDRGTELYDTTKGIPTSEDLYVNVFGKSYLFDYAFGEVAGTKSYSVVVSKTYNLSWEQDDGGDEPYTYYDGCSTIGLDGTSIGCPGHSGTHWVSNWNTYTASETVIQSYSVPRHYSYWLIDSLAVYGLDKAVVNNVALPSGSHTLTPNGYTAPTVGSQHSSLEADHIVEPVSGTTSITLASSSISGGQSGRPSIPSENWYSNADSAVGQIKVKNDRLIFNGGVIMNDLQVDTNTPDPGNIPTSPIVDPNTLYAKDLKIDTIKANGTFTSTGTIYYTQLLGAINPSGAAAYNQPITGINSVVVHTPVFCDGGIFSNNDFNQEITPDKSRATIVLGMASYFRLSTLGQHKNILGYGNKDYSKFTKTKQVKFPFDVYINTTTTDKTKFLVANTWYEVPLTQDDVNIFVPTWVEEGDYTIEYRSLALNALNTKDVEKTANLDLTHYVGTDSSPVHVVGRLYGFKITDINNYPLWENIFRLKMGAEAHSDIYYYSGLNNQNGIPLGITNQYILPIMEGRHPTVKNQALPTGYTFKYELETVGDYSGTYDAISVTPRFYYIGSDGTDKQAVDLYYNNENFDGKTQHFVKIDNNVLNRKNVKYCTLGDPSRNVPRSAIKNTSAILGVAESTFRTQKVKLGYFDWTVLTEKLRTFVGDISNLPADVNVNTALSSVQHWYGEYYLPNDLFIAPKGFDVIGYAKSKNGLDGNESFWLKKGYIVVNFDMNTCKDIDSKGFTNPTLSYQYGEANMWQIEGYDISQTDSNGVLFNLEWGDIAFYYSNYKSSEDYSMNGTH